MLVQSIKGYFDCVRSFRKAMDEHFAPLQGYELAPCYYGDEHSMNKDNLLLHGSFDFYQG